MINSKLLSELETALNTGELNPDAVSKVLKKYTKSSNEAGNKLMSILYFIGGGIVFMGIAFWIAQEWDHFGSIAKIICTLGISIGFFTSAVLLHSHEENSVLSGVFFLISALLMPLGLGVTYDELDFNVESFMLGTQISGILSAVFITSYFLFKRNLLLFIAIVFTSCLILILTDWMVSDKFLQDDFDFNLYRLFFLGLAWMFLGYAFEDSERDALSSYLYSFGVIAVLSTGLVLGNWEPNQNIFWELIYPGLALGIVFLSTVVKSRAFLIFGSLGFGAHLCKITAEYFSDSLGWPLALILMGFTLIGIAFAAVRIKNKYINVAV